jgi:hypothetical protein
MGKVIGDICGLSALYAWGFSASILKKSCNSTQNQYFFKSKCCNHPYPLPVKEKGDISVAQSMSPSEPLHFGHPIPSKNRLQQVGR